jgi:TrmH family RNA methyltransferase
LAEDSAVNYIQSSQNNTIKEIKALHLKKHRDAQGQYFVEGIRFVGDAVDSGQSIIKAVVSDRLESLNGGKQIISKLSTVCSEIYNVPDKLFREISDTQSPQGVLAVLKKQPIKITEVISSGKSAVVLDSLQDPGNVGTIIRTAEIGRAHV